MDISYYKKYEPIFGEWKIVREIGEGSFGKVFEIEREDFGHVYKAAMKAIIIPQSQSELKNAMLEFDGSRESVTAYFRGFIEEMVEEFVLMSRLKGCSNVVSYEDHKVIPHEDGIGWDILIRMELLTPLTDYVSTAALDRSNIIKLGADMCRALEHCRQLNIIHRDIKPENVFVSEFGSFKLGDFGVAKTLEKTTGGMSKKGTYSYMAPEIYKGEPYGASVDIYSLGMMLYRFTNNNRTAFLPPSPLLIKASDKDAALIRRIRGEALPAPANADAELAEIILKACAYKPEDRYKSPTEMREALETLVNTGSKTSCADRIIDATAEGTTAINKSTAPSEKLTVKEADVSFKTPIHAYETADISEETMGIFSKIVTLCKETVAVENNFSGETEVPDENDEGTVILEEKEFLPEDAGECEEPHKEEMSTEAKESTPDSKKLKKKRNIILAAIAAVIAVVICIVTMSDWTDIVAISDGNNHTVGLKSNGAVVATGDNVLGQCDVKNWTDIVAIAAGGNHTVGLKSDGTVVAVGSNFYGNCEVENWTDIVAISASYGHTVGLKSDGTVVAVGYNDDGQCDVENWTDIIEIASNQNHTVGLKSDGTVVAVGRNNSGQCDVESWADVVAISAGDSQTLGLKSDGTVVAVGENYFGQCDVEKWTDVVAISAGGSYAVGLKSDGTVVTVGENYYGQYNVKDWTDIVAISSGFQHTVGLKSDGTVVAVGYDEYGKRDFR